MLSRLNGKMISTNSLLNTNLATGTPNSLLGYDAAGNPVNLSTSGLLTVSSGVATVTGRIKATGDVTLYVTTTGNDSTGNGLTVGTAFATPLKAWQTFINNYDLGGHAATISLGNGTYAGFACTGYPVGCLTITITSTSGVASNVILDGTVPGNSLVVYQTYATITNITLSGGQWGINAQYGATVVATGVAFGAASSAHMVAEYSGAYISANNYTITSGTTYHAQAAILGNIQISGTITLTGAKAFTAFYGVSELGVIHAVGVTYTGGGGSTGSAYNISSGGMIATGNNGSGIPSGTGGTNSGGYFN